MNTPFLGSKISLISKSEIRYEGILYTIDTNESTIALSKVRSYGTENRSPDKPIPPRDEVYEYIIFRASDIKDLIVDDPPAAGLAPGLADPAIIQAHSIGGGAPSNAGIQSSGNGPSTIGQRASNSVQGMFGTSITTSHSGVTSGPPSGPAFGSSGGSTPTPTQGQINRTSPTSDSGIQQHSFEKASLPQKDSREMNSRWQNRGNHRMQFQNKRPGLQGPMQQHQQRPNPSLNYRIGGGRQGPAWSVPPNRGRMGHGGPMISRPPPQPRAQFNRGPPHRPKPENLKIDGDYDFEKANQEFQDLEKKLSKIKVEEGGDIIENKVTEEVEEQEKNTDKKGDEENQFYDKTKSFFDKISCEAIERSKGKVSRIDWKQERKMNAETFGVVPNRYRTGFRGRGYGYNNRNRNYYNQRPRNGPQNHAGGDMRKAA